jgi:hypothetical protein
MFAIIQECSVTHMLHYVQPGALTGVAGGGPGIRMMYANHADAERAAEKLRVENATRVEQTKRQRKFKTHPCTYEIVEMSHEKAVEISERHRKNQAARFA